LRSSSGLTQLQELTAAATPAAILWNYPFKTNSPIEILLRPDATARIGGGRRRNGPGVSGLPVQQHRIQQTAAAAVLIAWRPAGEDGAA